MKSRISLGASIYVISLLGSSGAYAQDATPPASDERSPEAEIIVTALKRAESLQRVAAAVSVVNSARLEAQGVTDLTQVSKLASGVSITPLRSQAFVFIRGVGQALTSPNADSSVAVNLNGVFLPAEIAGTGFFDVDRVEILPGPQGTLYGRASTGGVINIASRKPGKEFAVNGLLEYGNYDRLNAMVGVDIPLADGIYSRTAAQIVRRDGYFNNGEDDQKNVTVRQTFVLEPGENTQIVASAGYSHDGGIGVILQKLPFQECGPRCANFDPKALGYFNDTNTWVLSLQADHEISDNLSLTYIGGYNDLSLRTFNSIFTGPDLGPLRVRSKISSQSHEARLNLDFDNFQGLLGAYYFKQSTFFSIDARPFPARHVDAPFSAPTDGVAVFGQGTYTLTDALRLTGGLRYSRTTKAIEGTSKTYNATVTPEILVLSVAFAGRSTEGRTDWKAGFEFDLTPSSMLYASLSTGFTPGGFSNNPVALASTKASPFKSVSLMAYTAGLKNSLAGGDLTLNLEGYYYDYKNYQVSSRDILTGLNIVYNADKATIYGAQVDAHARVGRNSNLSVSATYLHAVADKLTAGGRVFDGFELPYAPKWTVNAFFQHGWDVGSNGAQVRASANFKYVSSRWALYDHSPGTLVDGETTTNLNFGYFAPDDRWSIQAFVRNLEDNLVKTTCSGVPPPAVTGCFFEPPRTYGVTVGFKL